MASFTAALKQWVIDTYQTKMGADDNYVTDAEKAALHSHANKTALDQVSGINTGDQDLSGLVPNTRTVNSKPLSANVTLTADDVGADPAGTAAGLVGALVIPDSPDDIGAAAATHTHADASETVKGLVELATTVEAAAGMDTARATTAAGVKAYVDGLSLPSTYAPIPTGTPDGTKYYRDDGTWATPPGSGGSTVGFVDNGDGTFTLSSDTALVDNLDGTYTLTV